MKRAFLFVIASKTISFLVTAFSRIPLKQRRLIGRFFGSLYYLLPSSNKRITELQIQAILGSQYSGLGKEVFEHFGEMIAETLNLSPILSIEANIDCPRLKEFQDFCAGRRQGILALTAHLGNWELLGAFMSAHSIPITAIGRNARSSIWQNILDKIRRRAQVATIWRTNRSSARKICEKLANHEVLAAVIDQDTYVDSLPIAFFNETASTPSTVVKIAKRFNARIVAAFCVKVEQDRYKIVIEDIDSSAPIESVLSAYNKALERIILAYPTQWAWMHKRWRTRADKRLSRNEYVKFLESKLS